MNCPSTTRRLFIGGVLALNGVATCSASVAYGLSSSGGIARFDPYGHDTPVFITGSHDQSFASGFSIDSNGVGWSIDWSGHLDRIDLQAGTATPAGLVPQQSGFYKDMAWDQVNHRILLLHEGPFDIGVLNTTPGHVEVTSLGPISGITTGHHFTGLAAGADGVLTIGLGVSGELYDLTPEPGGLHAVARSHRSPGYAGFEGMEYDPDAGNLLTSTPTNRVLPDGTMQLLRSDTGYVDIAFVPVPGPSSVGILVVGSVMVERRRRAT